MNLPTISVVMPVYNGEVHIAEAIDSILAQTFTDFEFIIVDDASTDATSRILAGYALQDGRIRIIRNATNSKIAASLNTGIAASRALLIARMDADDWAHPERLTKQYALMQAHPDVAVCGTWLEVYETGERWQYPLSDADMRANLLFGSCFAHPSVMIRTEVLQRVGGYDTTMQHVEDYDLWVRLADDTIIRMANLPEVLLRYRIHVGDTRMTYRQVQFASSNHIRASQVRLLGITPSTEDMRVHVMLSGYAPVVSLKDWTKCKAWVLVLLNANERTPYAPQDVLFKRVLLQWYKVTMATRSGFLLLAICYDMLSLWSDGPLARVLFVRSIKVFFTRVWNKFFHNGIPSHVDC